MENVNSIKVGDVFARLTVVSIASPKHITCTCSCGGTKQTTKYKLQTGYVKSCGCLQLEARDKIRHLNLRHGQANSRLGYKSRTYGIWQAMKDRCTNPNRADYKHYGGRGISYDPSWSQFENFLADMGEAPEGLTLDRIDTNKPYCKENCRWTTRKQQGRNRRKSLRVTVDGEEVIVRDLLDARGIPVQRFRQRYYVYGWTLEEACELVPRKLDTHVA